MNRRKIFYAMNVRVNVSPKRDQLNSKLKLVSNDDWKKKVLLFVDDLFSVCFQKRLCISFSLETRLFTYALYCSLLRSSRRILPILAFFVTFLRDLLDSLYAVYLLLSLVALSLCIQPIFTGNLQKTSIYQGL